MDKDLFRIKAVSASIGPFLSNLLKKNSTEKTIFELQEQEIY